jgi:hypothetical protein
MVQASRNEEHLWIDQLALRSPKTALMGVAVARTHLKLLLPQARPLRSGLWVDELAAEAGAELFGVPALREAEHDHVVVVAAEQMLGETQARMGHARCYCSAPMPC